MRVSLFLFAAAFAAMPLSAAEAPEFKPMFDGDSLKGWVNPYDWGEVWIEDGVVNLKGTPKFFLVTEKTYGDFIVDAEIKVPVGGNSGLQVRCHYGRNKLWGYQAEVDTSDRAWSGGLYDEGRRGWLNPLDDQPEARKAFKNGEWNHYRVEAAGDHIRVWVNNILTTDYRDSMDIAGHIALQHHGEEGFTYQFRNVRIMELGRHEWQPLFNGENLGGWHTVPGGEWKVEDGAILGISPASEPRHGLLVSDGLFGDFTARLKFKWTAGNSGFYFRIAKTDRPAHAVGFQAEIDGVYDTGGLYETYGRAWVAVPDEEAMRKHYKPGEWTDMSVSAHDRRIVVHVNGYKSAELVDDPGRPIGHLALQLHGGQDMHVAFKDIEVLGKAE